MNWKVTILVVLGIVILAALIAFSPMRTMTIKVDLPPTHARSADKPAPVPPAT